MNEMIISRKVIGANAKYNIADEPLSSEKRLIRLRKIGLMSVDVFPTLYVRELNLITMAMRGE